MHKDILKGSVRESKQIVNADSLQDNIVEPFINFKELLAFWYKNVYHQRAIKLKAGILSQIEQSNLDSFLDKQSTAKEFLLSFASDLEIYGNAFLEHSGTPQNFNLYNILGYEARVDKNKNIYQVSNSFSPLELEGYHLKYYSPLSKYYGEPDYITVIEQIDTNKQADKYNSSFFKNGARPGLGVIFENSSPNAEQIEAFRSFFGKNYKGYDNAHKTILFHTGKTGEGNAPAKIRLEKLDSIDDMSFEKLKRVNKEEIIAAHGVPPRLVGIVTQGQLGGGKELIDQLHSFNQTVILPKKALIEEFFKNIGVELKIKELDITSFKDDSDLVTNLVNANIIDVQVARELLGFKTK